MVQSSKHIQGWNSRQIAENSAALCVNPFTGKYDENYKR